MHDNVNYNGPMELAFALPPPPLPGLHMSAVAQQWCPLALQGRARQTQKRARLV